MKEGTYNSGAIAGAQVACSGRCNVETVVPPESGATDTEMWMDTVDEAADKADHVVTLGYFSNKAIAAAAQHYPFKRFSILDFEFPVCIRLFGID